MEIDTVEIIEKKYIHNIKGVFSNLLKAILELENKGTPCVPSFIIIAAEKTVLSKNIESMMLELVEGVVENNCDDLLMKKDQIFFKDHWKMFVGKNTPTITSDIVKSIFGNTNKDGLLVYNQIYINDIFNYFYSAFKVSVKYVLLKSEIESMTTDVNGMVNYKLKNKVLNCCDGHVLSLLIEKHKIKGVPVP